MQQRHQRIPDSSSFEIIFPSRCCCCPFLTSTKLTLSPLERIWSASASEWGRSTEYLPWAMSSATPAHHPGVCCPFGVWHNLLDLADLWVEGHQGLLGCRDRENPPESSIWVATAGGKDPGQPARAAECSLASPGQQCAPSVLSQLQFISLLHLHLNRCDSKGEVYFNKL